MVCYLVSYLSHGGFCCLVHHTVFHLCDGPRSVEHCLPLPCCGTWRHMTRRAVFARPYLEEAAGRVSRAGRISGSREGHSGTSLGAGYGSGTGKSRGHSSGGGGIGFLGMSPIPAETAEDLEVRPRLFIRHISRPITSQQSTTATNHISVSHSLADLELGPRHFIRHIPRPTSLELLDIL
jgi:hypothetical protein